MPTNQYRFDGDVDRRPPHRIDYLIGPGEKRWTRKYFIICADAIGNGLSTSPSSSAAPSPAVSQVQYAGRWSNQQRLVTEKFGIQKLVTVIGNGRKRCNGRSATRSVSTASCRLSRSGAPRLDHLAACWRMLRQTIMADPLWNWRQLRCQAAITGMRLAGPAGNPV
jgi:homoserine acetyltransferase